MKETILEYFDYISEYDQKNLLRSITAKFCSEKLGTYVSYEHGYFKAHNFKVEAFEPDVDYTPNTILNLLTVLRNIKHTPEEIEILAEYGSVQRFALSHSHDRKEAYHINLSWLRFFLEMIAKLEGVEFDAKANGISVLAPVAKKLIIGSVVVKTFATNNNVLVEGNPELKAKINRIIEVINK